MIQKQLEIPIPFKVTKKHREMSLKILQQIKENGTFNTLNIRENPHRLVTLYKEIFWDYLRLTLRAYHPAMTYQKSKAWMAQSWKRNTKQ